VVVSASAISLGALLLFGIQPIVAKRLLPWFGGSAAVWITCLVFFQTALLAGYLYAHALHRRLGARAQSAVHVGALLLSLPALALLLSSRPIAGINAHPTLGVLGLLALTIGLPYVLLASTSPLLQAWLARRPGTAPPYRLYALSNLAALGALLSYPILIDPYVPWRRQATGWALLYAGFALLSAVAARRAARGDPAGPSQPDGLDEPVSLVGWAERSLWTGLAGCASLLLVAVTAHVTQQIVPAPLLWVVPLAAYLLSFVVCFEWPRLYWRPAWLGLLPVALVGMAYLMKQEADALGLLRGGALFVVGLLACCMVCHGEIARRRPDARHLTTYYLLIALGGALGGLFAGVVAPLLFNPLVELPLGLILTGFFGVQVILQALWPRLRPYGRLAAVAALPFTFGLYAMYVVEGARAATREYHRVVRSFYGQLRVRNEGRPGDQDASRTLVNGGIIHGTQWLDDARRRLPTSYYCETSGVGRALALLPVNRRQRVGVVGLGVGTLAAYGRPGDVYRIYEINPQVVRLAQTEFTFLRDSAAAVEVALGDARLRLEAEPPQEFDLLAVDAFSGDSVPTHLLTQEALALYVRHLAAGGILAVHISNRFVDFEPVLAAGALALRRPVVTVREPGEGEGNRLCLNSHWVLIPPRDGRKRYPALWQVGVKLELRPGFRPWTDELWSLYPVLRQDLR
jgi:protein-L-isoaspartate O-methyltransferase